MPPWVIAYPYRPLTSESKLKGAWSHLAKSISSGIKMAETKIKCIEAVCDNMQRQFPHCNFCLTTPKSTPASPTDNPLGGPTTTSVSNVFPFDVRHSVTQAAAQATSEFSTVFSQKAWTLDEENLTLWLDGRMRELAVTTERKRQVCVCVCVCVLIQTDSLS